MARRQSNKDKRVNFPVDLRCFECGESAKYDFDVEESQQEYLALWRKWHSFPAPCVTCADIKAKKEKRKCKPCGGTGTIWPDRRDGHKRILIPLPRLNVKIKVDPTTMPPLCEKPQSCTDGPWGETKQNILV